MSWARTWTFASTQITTAVLVHIYCTMVHHRFRYFHRDGFGRAIPNFYWDYAWGYLCLAVILSLLLVVLHARRRSLLYEWVMGVGYWLLLVWVGFALIAMEIPFTPITNLRGEWY